MDNIRYSNTEATDEEVVRAARLAHAHEFIERLPKGYQTHRLSTIRDADRIMVIGEGCIQEMGNHEELMEKKGIYYQMVTSQMGEMK